MNHFDVDEKQLTKKIKKRMNRKLTAIVTISVAIVATIFCIIQFVVFPFINSLYYNPLDGRRNSIGVSEWGQMSIDMSVFSELHLPGYEIPFIFTKPRGLGVYDLTLYQNNAFRNYSETVYQSQIVRGRMSFSFLNTNLFNGMSLQWIPAVYGNYTDTETWPLVDAAVRTELMQLPVSAQVKVFLLFENPLDMQALEQFVKQSAVEVYWAGVRCGEEEFYWISRYGFSPIGKRIPLSESAYLAEQYPLLELDHTDAWGGERRTNTDMLTAQNYETHFMSMLNYMSSRNEFLEIIGFADDYAKALEYVRENGMWCPGVVVSGSLDEIIELASNPLIQYIAIDDVIVSVFSRP